MRAEFLYQWTLFRISPEWWLRDIWRVRTEKTLLWLGRHMPRRVRYWATIVSCAEASQGQWGNEHPDAISMMTMLKRIESN